MGLILALVNNIGFKSLHWLAQGLHSLRNLNGPDSLFTKILAELLNSPIIQTYHQHLKFFGSFFDKFINEIVVNHIARSKFKESSFSPSIIVRSVSHQIPGYHIRGKEVTAEGCVPVLWPLLSPLGICVSFCFSVPEQELDRRNILFGSKVDEDIARRVDKINYSSIHILSPYINPFIHRKIGIHGINPHA